MYNATRYPMFFGMMNGIPETYCIGVSRKDLYHLPTDAELDHAFKE